MAVSYKHKAKASAAFISTAIKARLSRKVVSKTKVWYTAVSRAACLYPLAAQRSPRRPAQSVFGVSGKQPSRVAVPLFHFDLFARAFAAIAAGLGVFAAPSQVDASPRC